MKKLPFAWLYRQSKNEKTKLFIRELENKIKSIKRKDIFTIINIKQKFPLKLGKWNIWLNRENSLNSLENYLEIFKYKHHTKITNFPSKNNSVVIDLGANEGFYVLKVKEMAPKSKIIAVEPNPSAFKVLKKNVEANKLKNIIIVNKAVTSKNGKINFEIVKGLTEIGAVKVYKKFRKRNRLKKIVVNSITLDRLCKKYKINKIDLLKIDVEGSELDILKSSKNILSKIDKAIIEYHEAQKTITGVKKIMVKNNFKILFIDRQKYYGDIYFLKFS